MVTVVAGIVVGVVVLAEVAVSVVTVGSVVAVVVAAATGGTHAATMTSVSSCMVVRTFLLMMPYL